MVAPIIIDATATHTASVVFVHGLGDSGAGWLSFVKSLVPNFPHIRFILPTAPNRVVTVTGMRMNAWFDVRVFHNASPDPANEDQAGMLAAAASIDEIVQAEVDSGIPAERIVVAGFSQGCIVSLLLGMTTSKKLAGILGLSGFLPLSDKLATLQSEQSKSFPFFWGHGTEDPMIGIDKAKKGVTQLKALGVALDFRSYEGLKHSVSPEEIEDIEVFLHKVLP